MKLHEPQKIAKDALARYSVASQAVLTAAARHSALPETLHHFT